MLQVRQKLLLKGSILFLTTVGTILFNSIFLRFAEVSSALFSWTLHFSLMFWISMVTFYLAPALNAPYFNSHPKEKEGRIYTVLGVHWFRRLLVLSGWEKLNRKNNPIRKTLPALQQYERATRTSEFNHTVIAFIVVLITGYVWVKYSFRAAFWLLLFNVLLNIYPIIVQRYNRPRLRQIIKKMRLPAI